jgi:hypothetical protein
MDLSILLDNKIFIGFASAVGGIIIAVLTQYILNKRGLFTYTVFHTRVGLSTEDAIYGSVKVTWNEHPVAHLFLSTIELVNQSVKDYESVVVRVFSSNAVLLSQRTEIVGTTRLIDFTTEYKREIAVPAGSHPTESQFDLFRRQRDYLIPTMNRGQILRFQFLNAAKSEEQPTVWLDVLHKGVKCKFQGPQTEILGVPQSEAVIAGTLVSLIAIGLVITYVTSLPFAALLSFLIGWLVLVPGAYTVKGLRKVRDLLAG